MYSPTTENLSHAPYQQSKLTFQQHLLLTTYNTTLTKGQSKEKVDTTKNNNSR